jgi:PAS domain S-box-containing protein
LTLSSQSEQTSKARLAAEKAKADALFSSIGDGVIATDEHGKIMKANAAALDLLGYAEADLIGNWYLKVVRAYDLKGKEIDPISRPIMRALLEGKPITQNLQYIKKDKSLFPTTVTAAPIMLNDKPIGTIQVFRDITREQEVDKAKTEFVSLASHQLRTPLTALRWYLELFLKGEMGKLTSEQHESLEEVYNVNLRLIDLVKSLLSVARIELGTLAFSPEPSSIEQLARDVVFELKPQIIDKHLHFSEQYDPEIPPIPLDADLTHVIFQNLLSNAVKYTPDGGHVRLKIVREAHSVLIEVTDTGYGIPKNQERQLFTKLFRADNVREKETDGTGLGLYIVKSIVKASHGKVWFESEENNGTTFYVRLPLKGMPSIAGKDITDHEHKSKRLKL